MRSSDHGLLACPRCAGELHNLRCGSCGVEYRAPGGIPDLRVPSDARTEAVREFYARAPFPGYPPRDSLPALHARAARSGFARALDHAIPGDALVLEIGCGTGQLSLFLASADRRVVGADLARPSLELARAAAARYGVRSVQFVETDLRAPGLRRAAFDVVICSGVLHHTADPRASFAAVAQLARPGGVVVIGLYNAYARVPLRLRRGLARLTGFRWVPWDPVLATAGPSPRGAKRGCVTSTTMWRSTGTRCAKCSAGFAKTASSTCAPSPARSWRTSNPISSPSRPMTGHSRPLSRSSHGCAR